MLTKNSHMSYSDRQIIETGIENGVFQDVGVSISPIDLKRVVRRKMSKQKRNTYSHAKTIDT